MSVLKEVSDILNKNGWESKGGFIADEKDGKPIFYNKFIKDKNTMIVTFNGWFK